MRALGARARPVRAWRRAGRGRRYGHGALDLVDLIGEEVELQPRVLDVLLDLGDLGVQLGELGGVGRARALGVATALAAAAATLVATHAAAALATRHAGLPPRRALLLARRPRGVDRFPPRARVLDRLITLVVEVRYASLELVTRGEQLRTRPDDGRVSNSTDRGTRGLRRDQSRRATARHGTASAHYVLSSRAQSRA